MKAWLAGKKTYLLAGVLLVAAVVCVGYGKLTPASALVMLAVTGFPVTFRAAIERHQKEEVALLAQLVATGVAVAGRNLPAALSAGEAAALSGAQLAEEIHAECGTPSDRQIMAAVTNAAARAKQGGGS